MANRKIDLDLTFQTLDEKTIPKFEGNNNIPLLLSDVLRMAATAELSEDTSGGGIRALEIKQKNFDLNLVVSKAQRSKTRFIELTEDEITHLKPRIAMAWTTLVAIPAINHLTNGVVEGVTKDGLAAVNPG